MIVLIQSPALMDCLVRGCAFIMQKEKRTDNKAILDIVGRDQQDQRLQLLFERERCVRNLTKAETKLWKKPPDHLLETIAKLVSPECPEWERTVSLVRDRFESEVHNLSKRKNG